MLPKKTPRRIARKLESARGEVFVAVYRPEKDAAFIRAGEFAEIEEFMRWLGNLGKKRIPRDFVAHAAMLAIQAQIFALEAFLRIFLTVVIEEKHGGRGI